LYADLPKGLTAADAGEAHEVQADGKLYVWSGSRWPADGAGSDFRGPKGDVGAAGGAADVAVVTHAAVDHPVLVDADEFPVLDSVSTPVAFALRRLSWASLKTAILAWFGPVTATLSNKTLDGTHNTFSNIPPEATPQAARLIGWTASTSTAGWAKLLTFDMTAASAAAFQSDISLLLSINYASSGSADAAIIGVKVRYTSAATPVLLGVEMVSHAYTPSATYLSLITPDAFKLVGGTGTDPIELWIHKSQAQFGGVGVYEIGKRTSGSVIGVVGAKGSPWQAAEPTGAVEARSRGVTVSGVPVVTTTAAQSLSNKTLVSPTISGNAVVNGAALGGRVAVPATATTAAKPGDWAADATWHYSYTGNGTTHTWVRSAAAAW
jgi:hypothetical protein